MIGPFAPRFSGRFAPATLSPTLLRDLAACVRSGELLPHAPSARNRYVVTRETASSLQFVAQGLLTSASVGINDVRLELDPRDDGALQFEVHYGGWTRYVVGLSLGIVGLAVATVLLTAVFLPQRWGAPSESAWLLWPMAIFWGLVWPWLLVAMHKPMARRVLIAVLAHANGGQEPALTSISKWRVTRRRSETVMGGWPLWVIAVGPDRETGATRGIARGWLAVGDVAIGGIAVGGVAVGGVSVGGLSIGLLALGGAALGGVAFGGLAVGGIAFGGMAIGWYAVGGGALGVHAVGGSAGAL